MTGPPERGVIALLASQALAFGVMLALLVIPANALFLDAYGAKWLPATYIAIAVIGTATSAWIARAARRTKLVRVAGVSLAGLAVLYAASWLILVRGGIWVSAVLLVVFPLALQIGFVFIGGQAGRLLDVRQMKERFPRVVAGFSVGFLVGGLLAIPLLALLGSTENLLLGSTAAQLAFLGLLLATERRFPEVRSTPTTATEPTARPSARAVFTSGLVLLLLLYQVLSAMGSWVVDYLLFNRAHAQFSGDDLTRFLSWYTAAVNLASILFLALLAGPLLRRFGLRLGLVLNPVVVSALLVVMAVIVAGPGAAAYGLFAVVAVAGLADIVLTDGTTRASVNGSFQLVPIRDRLAVQAFVEGIGVPVAIGTTGAVLLVMNLIGLGVGAVIAFGVVLGVLWTVSGFAMYRSYTRALADEMRRRSLDAIAYDVAADDAALQALLRSDDARDVRLALDLLPGVGSETSVAVEALHQASEHADPEVRVQALLQLTGNGDARAGAEVSRLAVELARSEDPAARRAAAVALGSPEVARAGSDLLIALLDDDDTTVRAAALDAVVLADAGEPEIVRRVVAALEEPRTAGSATAAVSRVGDSAVPLLAAALARDGASRRPALLRAAANAATEHGLAIIEPALRDRDRVVVLAAIDALDAANASAVVPPDLLGEVLDDATAHASRALAAQLSLTASDGSLRRALEDESELARRLVVSVLALRHGDGVREAVRVVDCSEGQRQALGLEALDVLISREEARFALPLVRRDLTLRERVAELRVDEPARGEAEWIADIAQDPRGVWRSGWLARCARDAPSR